MPFKERAQTFSITEFDLAEAVDDVKRPAGKVDDALQFAIDHGDVTWTETEESEVTRKIDIVILPLLFFGSIFSYADSQVFGFAAIFGMIKDLGLFTAEIIQGNLVIDTQKYSFAGSMASLGALASMYPLLLLAQRLPVGKFLGAISIYAGMCSMLIIACKDFAGIMTLRFFYGFQAVSAPLSIIITSMWWKTNEQPLRIGVWVGGAGIGNLIGQGIGFAGIHLEGIYAASPWKWLYVIFGSMAMGFGLIIVALLPATPMKAWFLNEREQTIAVRRLIGNHTGIQTKSIKWSHIVESAMDPQLWVFCTFIFSLTFANNASGTFAGLLVTSFGYSSEQAILISMPASAVAIICMYGAGFLLSKFPRHRLLVAILFLLPTIAGNAILWKAPRDNIHALLAGLYMAQVFYGAFIAVSSLISSNVGGHTKKTTVNAIIGIFSSCGGFAGPWAYKGEEADQGYPTGQASTMALMALSCVALGALWFHYKECNEKKAVLTKQCGDLVQDPNIAFHDLTDKENPVFQYSY